jgi:hypothetical protein
MRERNSANAQTRVELKTARWRPRREIDEFAAAGPAPIPFHGKSPCTQARTASFSARRSPQRYLPQATACTLTG